MRLTLTPCCALITPRPSLLPIITSHSVITHVSANWITSTTCAAPGRHSQHAQACSRWSAAVQRLVLPDYPSISQRAMEPLHHPVAAHSTDSQLLTNNSLYKNVALTTSSPAVTFYRPLPTASLVPPLAYRASNDEEPVIRVGDAYQAVLPAFAPPPFPLSSAVDADGQLLLPRLLNLHCALLSPPALASSLLRTIAVCRLPSCRGSRRSFTVDSLPHQAEQSMSASPARPAPACRCLSSRLPPPPLTAPRPLLRSVQWRATCSSCRRCSTRTR